MADSLRMNSPRQEAGSPLQESQAQPYDFLSTQGGVHTPPEGLSLNLPPPQEEMYIFMEYCDEGTLEEVSRLGLQEHVIRLYSKQITVAINVLHEHGIVHRDIKGANIFLTSSGLIKLGDFGCSVKLKNNTQTMPGEVNSTLGTAGKDSPRWPLSSDAREASLPLRHLVVYIGGNYHSCMVITCHY